MKPIAILLFLLFAGTAKAQSTYKNYEEYQAEYDRLTPFEEYSSDFSSELMHLALLGVSCDSARKFALTNRDTIRYLIPDQFYESKEAIIKAYILKNDYDIIASKGSLSCSGDTQEIVVYRCYNNAVDSFLSRKYSINFSETLKTKVDREMQKTKDYLLDNYPFLKFYYEEHSE